MSEMETASGHPFHAEDGSAFDVVHSRADSEQDDTATGGGGVQLGSISSCLSGLQLMPLNSTVHPSVRKWLVATLCKRSSTHPSRDKDLRRIASFSQCINHLHKSRSGPLAPSNLRGALQRSKSFTLQRSTDAEFAPRKRVRRLSAGNILVSPRRSKSDDISLPAFSFLDEKCESLLSDEEDEDSMASPRTNDGLDMTELGSVLSVLRNALSGNDLGKGDEAMQTPPAPVVKTLPRPWRAGLLSSSPLSPSPLLLSSALAPVPPLSPIDRTSCGSFIDTLSRCDSLCAASPTRSIMFPSPRDVDCDFEAPALPNTPASLLNSGMSSPAPSQFGPRNGSYVKNFALSLQQRLEQQAYGIAPCVPPNTPTGSVGSFSNTPSCLSPCPVGAPAASPVDPAFLQPVESFETITGYVLSRLVYQE